MSRWQSRVNELLYEGESVQEVVDIETAKVVVTSHRVMAFTPDMDGENFQQVDRPNIAGVETSALANTTLLGRSLRYGIYGVLLLLAGFVLDFDGILGDTQFDSDAAGQTGAGGIVDIAQTIINFIARLDELMQIAGVLIVLLAGALFGVYWLLRDPTLVIRIAGDIDDIHVPHPDDADATVNRLQQAIIPDPSEVESDSGLSSKLRDELR